MNRRNFLSSLVAAVAASFVPIARKARAASVPTTAFARSAISSATLTTPTRLRRYYAIDFGFVGDGKADNAEAVKRMTEVLAQDSGCVYFPAGIYRLGA